jgi:hypothetical protein
MSQSMVFQFQMNAFPKRIQAVSMRENRRHT